MQYIRQYAVFLVLLVVCGFLLYSVYTDIELKTITEHNNEQIVLANQAAAGIERFFTTYNSSLSFLAQNRHIIRLDSEGREQMREFYTCHAGEISSITRVDEDGIIIYTYPVETSIGTNISSQSHVRQLINTHSVVISDVFTSVQGFRTIAFHMPVFIDGTFKGSIALLIPFDTLAKKNLGTIRVLDSGYAWAVSQNGVVLYSPYPEQIDTSVFEVYINSPTVTAMVLEAMKGLQGASTYTINADPVLHVPSRKFEAVYLPVTIETTHWSIIIATPENEILGTIQGSRNNIIIISAILAISLLFFTYYISRARGIVKEEEIRKKAEDDLRESEEFNRSLVENLPDIIAIYDSDGIVLFANKTALTILGSESSQVIGKPILSFVADYQHSDIEKKMRARLSGARLAPYEVDIKTGCGEVITAILKAVPIMYRKKSVVLVLMTNITDRKQAELELYKAHHNLEEKVKERTNQLTAANQELEAEIQERRNAQEVIQETLSLLHATIESTGNGLLVVNTARKITTHNTQFAEMWHLSDSLINSQDDKLVMNALFREVKNPEEFAATVHEVYATLDQETSGVITLEDNRTFEWYSKPQRIRDDIVGRVWIFQDITQRKEMEDAIEKSLADKEMLLKEIHHRVKNNMQVVSSLLFMQARKIKDEKVQEILLESQNRIKSIALVHERIYLSEDLDNIDYTDYIRKITRYLFESYLVDPGRISLTVSSEIISLSIDKAVPCSLIINELVSNAVKHAFPQARKGTIQIDLKRHADTYVLVFRDDGVGIPERIDVLHTKTLGLELIRGLVRQLNGTIELDRNAGTAYTITFPV